MLLLLNLIKDILKYYLSLIDVNVACIAFYASVDSVPSSVKPLNAWRIASSCPVLTIDTIQNCVSILSMF